MKVIVENIEVKSCNDPFNDSSLNVCFIYFSFAHKEESNRSQDSRGEITGVKIKIESFVTFMLTFILAVCQKQGLLKTFQKNGFLIILLLYCSVMNLFDSLSAKS